MAHDRRFRFGVQTGGATSAREWKEKSRFFSNTAQMALLRPYQAIIGMGTPVVPLILEEQQQPQPFSKKLIAF